MKLVGAFLITLLIISSCDYRYKRVYEQEYSLSPSKGVKLLSGGSQKRWKIIERTVDGHYMNLGGGGGCQLFYRGIFDVNGMYQPGTEEGHDYCGEWVFMQNRPYMREDEPSEYSYSFHESKPYLYLHTNKLIEPYLILKLVPDTLIIGSYSYQEWDIVKKDTIKFFVVQTLIAEHIPNETRYHHM
jgi:hypothetical protein